MTFRALLAGCWFGHDVMTRERIKGRYALVCQKCGQIQTFPRQKLRLIRRLPVTRTKVRDNVTSIGER